MKKNKTGHFETFHEVMFPQSFTKDNSNGETNQGEQPTIDEIWGWLGHLEIEDSV